MCRRQTHEESFLRAGIEGGLEPVRPCSQSQFIGSEYVILFDIVGSHPERFYGEEKKTGYAQ